VFYYPIFSSPNYGFPLIGSPIWMDAKSLGIA
jgi:hypothetical protein